MSHTEKLISYIGYYLIIAVIYWFFLPINFKLFFFVYETKVVYIEYLILHITIFSELTNLKTVTSSEKPTSQVVLF